LFPQLYVSLFQAAEAGDLELTRRLHGVVLQVTSAIYAVENRPGSVIKGLKSALAWQEICSDTMAEPFTRFAEPQRNVVRRHLDELAGAVQQACSLATG
ncbi:MAG: hypothetical protein HUU20_23355, partial [Pirellulales bacterium]|nr:hypothetical protein [Pirellulales bacterium]